MPLANRAGLRAHTINRFRAAAGARYREAQALDVAGHRLGAIYLYGYVAEMLLKAAYFRAVGWAPNGAITHHHLGQARTQAIQHHGLLQPGNLHDLTGWTRLLIHTQAAAYPLRYRNQLLARVNQVYIHWREWLRYHDMRPFAGEVERVRSAVNWLLAQYPRL